MGNLPSAPDADREAVEHLATRLRAALAVDERRALLAAVAKSRSAWSSRRRPPSARTCRLPLSTCCAACRRTWARWGSGWQRPASGSAVILGPGLPLRFPAEFLLAARRSGMEIGVAENRADVVEIAGRMGLLPAGGRRQRRRFAVGARHLLRDAIEAGKSLSQMSSLFRLPAGRQIGAGGEKQEQKDGDDRSSHGETSSISFLPF